MGPFSADVLAKALDAERESPLRQTLTDLDISTNRLSTGKQALFATIPGTQISKVRVNLGTDDISSTLDKNDDELDLRSKALGNEDSALLAGWIRHVGQMKALKLSDNAELVEEGSHIGAFEELCDAMEGTALDTLELADTGMQGKAGSRLAAAISSAGSQLQTSLTRLDVGSNKLGGQDDSSWEELCAAVKGSNIADLTIASCSLTPDNTVKLAGVLANPKLTRLDLGGNSLFGQQDAWLGSGENSANRGGWDAVCEAFRSISQCAIEDLSVSSIQLGPPGLETLTESLPAALRKLDISDNHIASRALVRLKPNTNIINPTRGGRSGTTGRGSIDKGVVCITKDGTCFVVKKHERGTDTVTLTNLETERDEKVQVGHLLLSMDAYAKKSAQIGSFKHIEEFWPSIAKRKSLVALNLSNCGMDRKSVFQLSRELGKLQHLEELKLTATGDGPWRGHNGKAFGFRDDSVDYSYTLCDNAILDLDGKHLGPEDLVLVSAWIQRSLVSEKLRRLILSNNKRLFGNGHTAEDDSGLASGVQYIILQRAVLRQEASTKSTELGHLEGGLLVNVTREAEHESGDGRVRLFCEGDLRLDNGHTADGGWISHKSKDDQQLAAKVRDQQGWDALCKALDARQRIQNANTVVVEARNVGMGSLGLAAKAAVESQAAGVSFEL